ncbi:vps15 protein kinase, partial [Nannochloropsis oceanica]
PPPPQVVAFARGFDSFHFAAAPVLHHPSLLPSFPAPLPRSLPVATPGTPPPLRGGGGREGGRGEGGGEGGLVALERLFGVSLGLTEGGLLSSSFSREVVGGKGRGEEGGGGYYATFPPTAAVRRQQQQPQQQQQQQQQPQQQQEGGKEGWKHTPDAGPASASPTRPPLPPDMGALCHPSTGHKFSYYVQDYTFFASASDDGHIKIWDLRGLESNVSPRSALTYSRQGGRILDVTMVDNTHSIASASSNGTVHVWRVDVVSGSGRNGLPSSSSFSPSSIGSSAIGSSAAASPFSLPTMRRGVRVAGNGTVIRTLDVKAEGPVVCIAHFNTESASLLVYATQRGCIHCWDLRTDKEVWILTVPRELGYLTALTLGTDRQSWLACGTNRGYLLLFDLRFLLLVKVWRHSARGPIHRLAAATRLPQNPQDAEEERGGGYIPSDSPSPAGRPLLFVAAGANEMAVWDLQVGGKCKHCFRSVLRGKNDINGSPLMTAPLPTLEKVPLPSYHRDPVLHGVDAYNEALRELSFRSAAAHEPSVRAIMGRITNNPASSYLITGSSDQHIRCWDFASPSKCYTVSGLLPGQPPPHYISPLFNRPKAPYVSHQNTSTGKLFLCQDFLLPPIEAILPSRLPVREQRGPVTPVTHHTNVIMDLKTVEVPMRLMLSCSKDETVKVWR